MLMLDEDKPQEVRAVVGGRSGQADWYCLAKKCRYENCQDTFVWGRHYTRCMTARCTF